MALTHSLYSPGEIALQIARNAKALRLSKNLSRRALAAQSGVNESTLKRFETTGKVSLDAMLLIATSLGVGSQLANLFSAPPPLSLQELKTQTRLRGRR
ncbi:XRE family transcriptional regulator [Pseudomonas marginalis ICMP 9505]|uniref:Helix-turn-helix transcriptional regulator n=1 Tax=Pseudomonas kitaguniensis TaxID=2607908 RepID=A0A5N7JUL5_9PSED|nr:helix-turn-helix transcriptional regulator [Pseudomonas kitaguniensis]KTC12058.1 XRE family transcriptional regulator [Pseudomonas marginalis ICMP 9505]MPQ85031.1 helix-turn-helix transcriptional regulator [Pseudomonas kitaguniensis]MPR04778.1 helix-turn-helix transcriptional regulator [Pseudomonas kitaguniensis]RMP63165.1 hypothetical protein ALQ18_01624 [Pseudomonas marginalis pv. marginalis]